MPPSTLVRTALRQPLLHFLCIGALLFAGYRGLNAADQDERTIRVEREQLLTLLQQRARQFDRERFARELDGMDAAQRAALEQAWLREEVLYREARALQLDRDDYVIRQRLVQKLEFVTRGFIESGAEPDQADVARYFDQHRDAYTQPPSITFTHVFISSAIHGRERAQQLAQETLDTLDRTGAGFADAPAHGDRYAYHSNYVERSEDYVASQFDAGFARALFADADADGRWRGPLASPLGFHLVLVANRKPAREPALDEVYAQVAADAKEARVQRELRTLVERMLARYDVSFEAPRS